MVHSLRDFRPWSLVPLFLELAEKGHYGRESLVEQSWSPDGRQRGAETQGQALVIVSASSA